MKNLMVPIGKIIMMEKQNLQIINYNLIRYSDQ